MVKNAANIGLHLILLFVFAGVCWTWGGNHYGQLGTEQAEKGPPTAVSPLAKTAFLTALACGSHSTAVVDDIGDVHVWGRLLAEGEQ